MAADIFSQLDAVNLLKGRGILMIGDSNVRCMYRDLICLCEKGTITPAEDFRAYNRYKPYLGDRILKMAPKDVFGRDYFENREYVKRNDICLRFIFVTRANSQMIQEEMKDIREGKIQAPKVVLMNSFLWDLTRWGPMKEDQYKKDLVKTFKIFKRSLPEDTLVVWLATMPVATEKVKGGVFIKQIEFMKHSMRIWALEGNKFVQQLCLKFQFNFLDLHYHLQYSLNLRAFDGIHWSPPGVRYITNIILTHIALNFDLPLPGNFQCPTLSRIIKTCNEGHMPANIYLEKEILEKIEKDDDDDLDKFSNKSNLHERDVKKAVRRNRKTQHTQSKSGLLSHAPTNLRNEFAHHANRYQLGYPMNVTSNHYQGLGPHNTREMSIYNRLGNCLNPVAYSLGHGFQNGWSNASYSGGADSSFNYFVAPNNPRSVQYINDTWKYTWTNKR